MTKVMNVGGFYVEVSEPIEIERGEARRGPGETQKTSARGQAEAAAESLKDSIASVCSYVKGAFGAANRPDEIKLKFGLKVGGEAGIPYVTKGSGEALLEVEATWKNPPSEEEIERPGAATSTTHAS